MKNRKKRSKIKKSFFCCEQKYHLSYLHEFNFFLTTKKPHFVQACDIIHDTIIVSYLCHYSCVMLSHKNWVLQLPSTLEGSFHDIDMECHTSVIQVSYKCHTSVIQYQVT